MALFAFNEASITSLKWQERTAMIDATDWNSDDVLTEVTRIADANANAEAE